MIHLIATVDADRIEWLPQFVEHYRGLGIQNFLISAHIDPDKTRDEKRQLSTQVERTLRSVGAPLFSVVHCRYDHECFSLQHNAIRSSACDESDWIVWADIDEFQEYPDSLERVTAQCDELGIPQVRGKFIDRVARDGSLPPFDPSRSIWEQYPVGADVTSRISGGGITKVVASKATYAISPGHHHLENERAGVYPLEVTIHHFKWDATVVGRMKPRLEEDFKRECEWWGEAERFLDHIRRFGKIRLDVLRHAELGTPDRRTTLADRDQLDSGGAASGTTR